MPVDRVNIGLRSRWTPGEDGWSGDPGVDGNFDRLDVLVQPAVKDKDLAAPPGSPVEGDRYVVAASPTGAWAGHAGQVTVYHDAVWHFYIPKEGWLEWVNDEDKLYVYNGTAWAIFTGATGGAGYLLLLPRDFSGAGVASLGTGDQTAQTYSLSGTADTDEASTIVVPGDLASLTSLKLLYAQTVAASTNPFKFRVGLEKWADAEVLLTSPTFGTVSTITPPTTVNEIDVVTLNLPAVSLLPGEVWRLHIQRQATDAGDTNTDTMALLAILMQYAKA